MSWGRVEYLGEKIWSVGGMRVEYLGDKIWSIGGMRGASRKQIPISKLLAFLVLTLSAGLARGAA